MSKECVTHHHACDCREAKFAELEAELSALQEKYADIQVELRASVPVAYQQRAMAELTALRGTLLHITKMNDHNFRVSDIHEVAKAALLKQGGEG